MSEAVSEATISANSNSSKKQIFGLALGVLISVGILAALVFSIDWASFFKELKRVEPIYIPLFAVVFLITYWLRAQRWKYLLPNSQNQDVKLLFDAFSLGSLAMYLLPFRAGEIIRAYTLQKWTNVSFAVGFASIITERAFDVLSLLILFGICLARIEQAPAEVLTAAWALGSIAAGILAVMLLCYFLADQMLALFKKILKLVFRDKLQHIQEKLIHFASEVIIGFRAIQSTKELLIVLSSSLILWVVFGLLYQVTLWCFSEQPSFWVGITLSIIVALAIAIPSAPGFLGVFQLGCVLALSGIFGYSKEFALAYAVLCHSLQFIMVVIIGFWVLRSRGLSLSELRRKNS